MLILIHIGYADFQVAHEKVKTKYLMNIPLGTVSEQGGLISGDDLLAGLDFDDNFQTLLEFETNPRELTGLYTAMICLLSSTRCIHTCIHIYICTYIYLYIHILIHTYSYLHMYIHVLIYTYTYTYIYIHLYIHIHTYIHTYTHTYVCLYIHRYPKKAVELLDSFHSRGGIETIEMYTSCIYAQRFNKDYRQAERLLERLRLRSISPLKERITGRKKRKALSVTISPFNALLAVYCACDIDKYRGDDSIDFAARKKKLYEVSIDLYNYICVLIYIHAYLYIGH